MQIELQRDWKGYRTGRVLRMPAGAADVLLRRKIATAVGVDRTDEVRPRPKRRSK